MVHTSCITIIHGRNVNIADCHCIVMEISAQAI